METNKKTMQSVYTVVQRADGKEIWIKIGAAFPNRDGSLSVLLDAVPTNGRLQIREYTPRDVERSRPQDAPQERVRPHDAVMERAV